MEHVKQLVLMPEHMAENTTQSKSLVSPLTSQVNHLDSEMDSLLERQDIIQDEKARLYSQILVNDTLCHRKNFNPHGWRLVAKAIE